MKEPAPKDTPEDHLNRMTFITPEVTAEEVLSKIYARLPDFTLYNYSNDQLYDRCEDFRQMIEEYRIVKEETPHPQNEAGIDY
tara:strand:+ start:222 stop:470 length:249 start_codon:yes stop_codon:yes gene_type:complete